MSKPLEEEDDESGEDVAAVSLEHARRQREMARDDDLIARYLMSRSHEGLVGFVTELAKEDEDLRETLLALAHVDPLAGDALFAYLRGLIAEARDGNTRTAAIRAAIDRLYAEGHGERLLGLLREIIVAEESPLDNHATWVAVRLLKDLDWPQEKQLLWHTDTQLASDCRYDRSYVLGVAGDDEEFSVDAWSALADELLRRFENHTPFPEDIFTEEIANALWHAQRGDDLLDFRLRTVEATRDWDGTLGCILDSAPSPRLALAARRLLQLLDAAPEAPYDAREELANRLAEIERVIASTKPKP